MLRTLLNPAIPIAVVCGSALALHADVLELTHGGRVAGEIVNRDRAEDEPLVIRTQYGLITVSHEDVARVHVPSAGQKKYKQLVDEMPATADGNWQMAEWCRQNGLAEEREHHLREVIRLDPEHAAARQALGFVLRDGEWSTRNDIMQQRGFIRHRGRWRLPQEIALDEARDEQEATVRQWRTQIKRWRSWIGRRREEEAVAGLRSISDPLATAAIAELLPRESNPQVQRLYIEALGKLDTAAAANALVEFALRADDDETRLKCFGQLRSSGHSKLVVGHLVTALESNQIVILRRAAVGLAHLEDPAAIRPLIDALVTTHKVKVSPDTGGRLAPSFGSGPGGSAGGLSVGGRPRVEKRQVKNRPVLEALLALTDGVNYEFDQARWRQWYSQKHLPADINLRRDG